MKKIKIREIKACYKNAKDYYDNKVARSKAISELVNEYEMNKSSASDYIDIFKHMMRGERYERTCNKDATNYYLKNILQDYGQTALAYALEAQRKHLIYYESQKKEGKLLSQWLIYDEFNKMLDRVEGSKLAEEVSEPDKFKEGARKEITVNAFERSSRARLCCIAHHGLRCAACGLLMSDKYGDIGKNFIHVHHIVPLADVTEEYNIDPLDDLVPVCPNCHAMLHRRKPALTIDELRSIITDRTEY